MVWLSARPAEPDASWERLLTAIGLPGDAANILILLLEEEDLSS